MGDLLTDRVRAWFTAVGTIATAAGAAYAASGLPLLAATAILFAAAAAWLAVLLAAWTGRDAPSTHDRGFQVLFGLVAVASILGGFTFAYARSSAAGPPAKLVPEEPKGAIELTIPPGWSESDAIFEVPGLDLRDPIVAMPSGSSNVMLLAGTTGATGARLLSRDFLGQLLVPPKVPQAIRLAGGLEVYDYRYLTLAGVRGSLLRVLVAPTTVGVATIVCYATSWVAATRMLECEAAVLSAKLRRGDAYPLGPSIGYADALTEVVGSLAIDHRRLRGALRRGTAAEQTALAEQLERVFRDALDDMPTKVSPRDRAVTRRIAAGLRETGDAYGRLTKALAAVDGGQDAVDRASRRVRVSYRKLRECVSSLEALGYRVK